MNKLIDQEPLYIEETDTPINGVVETGAKPTPSLHSTRQQSQIYIVCKVFKVRTGAILELWIKNF